MYDVIVIGGGPAGLSAAINAIQRGAAVCVVSTPLAENPLARAQEVANYPGLPGSTGTALLTALRDHALAMGAEIRTARVLRAMQFGQTWMVSAGEAVLEGRALIFAGGVLRGKKYPGEEALLGRGVSYCATCDGFLYRGKKVVVIGFSAEAAEEADYLRGIGCEVHYAEKPKQAEILGEKTVEAVRLGAEEIPCAGVFILRPTLAPTEVIPEIETEGAFIKVDRGMQTNLPGLWAAGDCTGAPLQAAKAVGEGCIAGQAAADWAKKLR